MQMFVFCLVEVSWFKWVGVCTHCTTFSGAPTCSSCKMEEGMFLGRSCFFPVKLGLNNFKVAQKNQIHHDSSLYTYRMHWYAIYIYIYTYYMYVCSASKMCNFACFTNICVTPRHHSNNFFYKQRLAYCKYQQNDLLIVISNFHWCDTCPFCSIVL